MGDTDPNTVQGINDGSGIAIDQGKINQIKTTKDKIDEGAKMFGKGVRWAVFMTLVVGGSLAGRAVGGLVGGGIGSFVAPGPGTVVGGMTGQQAGAQAGRAAGLAVGGLIGLDKAYEVAPADPYAPPAPTQTKPRLIELEATTEGGGVGR